MPDVPRSFFPRASSSDEYFFPLSSPPICSPVSLVSIFKPMFVWALSNKGSFRAHVNCFSFTQADPCRDSGLRSFLAFGVVIPVRNGAKEKCSFPRFDPEKTFFLTDPGFPIPLSVISFPPKKSCPSPPFERGGSLTLHRHPFLVPKLT